MIKLMVYEQNLKEAKKELINILIYKGIYQ